MVNVITTSRYPVATKQVREAALEVILSSRLTDQIQLNIVFVGTRKMRDVSLKYKQENVALPVLSFSYLNEPEIHPIVKHEGEGSLTGEVLICYPQAVLLAAQRNKTVDKMIRELVIHGVKNILNN